MTIWYLDERGKVVSRPVAMTWSREESIVAHHNRHPITIRCRWGAMRDGRITGVRAEVLAAQSGRIDTVSGATYTTRGYDTSLQSALDQAGLA